MKKKDGALRENLLNIAREIADAQGPEAISIRALAKAAGIAVGTVYNYFADKEELLLALTESYWQAALEEMQEEIDKCGSFCERLEAGYRFLADRLHNAGGMWMSSLRGVEASGHERMHAMQQGFGRMLLAWMEQDTPLRQDIWTESFTKERYAEFVRMNMMLLLKSRAPDMGFFVEIIQRTLY